MHLPYFTAGVVDNRECINSGLDYWNGGMVDCIVSFMIDFSFSVHFFNSLWCLHPHHLTLSHVHIHNIARTWLMVIQLDVSKFWKLITY